MRANCSNRNVHGCVMDGCVMGLVSPVCVECTAVHPEPAFLKKTYSAEEALELPRQVDCLEGLAVEDLEGSGVGIWGGMCRSCCLSP